MIRAIAILLLLSGCTSSQVGNTLYGTAIGSLILDYGQTRSIVRHPERWGEGNPILGPHPSFAQVDSYFPIMILGTAASYPIVKPEWRPYLYGAITLLESAVIVHNINNGLHMDFIGIRF